MTDTATEPTTQPVAVTSGNRWEPPAAADRSDPQPAAPATPTHDSTSSATRRGWRGAAARLRGRRLGRRGLAVAMAAVVLASGLGGFAAGRLTAPDAAQVGLVGDATTDGTAPDGTFPGPPQGGMGGGPGMGQAPGSAEGTIPVPDGSVAPDDGTTQDGTTSDGSTSDSTQTGTST